MAELDKVVGGGAEARAEAGVVEGCGDVEPRDGAYHGGDGRERETAATDGQPATLEHGDAIEAINKVLKKQDGGNLKIGEIVDTVIGPAGRADYGKRVIAKLAEDPHLMCTSEHLRRCWGYFRLMREHGEFLNKEYAELKYAHLYELSRLLKLEEGHGSDFVKDAISFMAKKAMDDGKGGKPIPADALAKDVTTHIKSIKGPGPNGHDDDRKVPDGEDGRSEETKALEDAYFALSDGIGAVQEAAGKIAKSGRYGHACRLQTDVDRIAQAHIDILKHIIRRDPESLVIEMARKRILALAGLVGLKLVENETAKHDEVAP